MFVVALNYDSNNLSIMGAASIILSVLLTGKLSAAEVGTGIHLWFSRFTNLVT